MAYIYDLTDTWNAGGTTFNAIKMNVTDSASAVSSKLVTLQTNGTEHFSVTKAGVGYVSGNLGVGTTIPSAKLEVARTDSAAGIRVTVGQGAYSGNVALFGVTGQSNGYYITKDAANNIQHIWDGTGGAERMRINSSGNVGIGCTPLSVTKFQTSIGTDRRFSVFLNGSDSTFGFLTDAGNWTDTLVNGSPLRFGTGGTERMRIDASGNVGIGTTAPLVKLDVDGSINARSGTVTADNFVNWGSNLVINAGGSLPIIFKNNGTESARIINGGNVGIGTSSPGYKLQVNGTMAGVVASGANYSAIRTSDFYYMTVSADGLNTLTDANGSAPMLFKTGGAERMRIDASGNLGLGVTPSAWVTGKAFEVGAVGNALWGYSGNTILSQNTAGYSANFIYANTAAATRYQQNGGAHQWFNAPSGTAGNAISFTQAMTLDASGNLLVGKTGLGSAETTDGAIFYKNASGGGMTAYVTNGGNGTALAVSTQANTNAVIFYRSATQVGSIGVTTTATSYNTSSDYRLKDIDGPVANSGAYIDALKPVQGSWKADGSRFIGLLAHEAQEVSETPIATGEKDGEEMQAMDYSAPELIANLIAELQSVRARLAQLEGN